jgi:hypothetical protein
MSFEIRIVLAVLAVYRLSRLLVIDDGPFDVFKIAHDNAAIRAGDSRLWDTIARLYKCQLCLGVWIAVLGVIAVVAPCVVSDIAIMWLGIAGAQAMIESMSGR